MPIHYLKTLARLEGHVGAEDAETLQQWLQAGRRRAVDLGPCDSVHTAVLQTLLALTPPLKNPPAHAWLCQALGLQPPPAAPTRTAP